MKFTLAISALALASVASASPVARKHHCVETYVAKAGDTCTSVASAHNVTVPQFYRWNIVQKGKGDCAALEPGTKYCVKVKHSHHKRTWFYKTDGLTGKKLALAKQKAAAAKKTTKKTAKKTTKKAAKKTTKKATTSKKASSTTGKAVESKPGDNWSSTPKNAPKGAVKHIISTCTKYAQMTSAYGWCGPFATGNKITQAQLFAWNGGLHKNCDNLDNGKYYCVGV